MSSPLRLLSLAGLLAGSAPLAAQDAYVQQLQLQFNTVSESLSDRGLFPDSEMFSGTANAGSSERFRITLQGGVAYQIVGVCDTDCSDVDLTLYDANSKQLDQDVLEDDVPVVAITPTSTGTYFVEVAMITCTAEPCYWGVQAFSASGSAGPASSSPALAGGNRIQGELRSGDLTLASGELYDVHEVPLQVGQSLTADLRSSDFDTYLIVRSPSGQATENDDHEGSTDRSRVQIEATEAGTWQVLATTFQKGMEGAYTVDIEVGGAATTAPPSRPSGVRRESGRLQSGDQTLSSGEFVDQYTFTGTAGEEVIIDLRSSEFDPYLLVRGPNDEQEDNDDYEGDVNRSFVRFSLPSSGSYRVAVTSYKAGEEGAYDLSIQQGATIASGVTRETGTLAAGDETLSTGEYVDEFTFQATPGEQVRVDLESSDFDTYVMLIGPGDFREENDDADANVGHSVIEANLTEGGTYRVLVTSYEPSETGSYDLSVTRGAHTTTQRSQRDVQSLSLDRPATGALAAGDAQLESGEFRDTWVFDGQAGQTVSFEVASTEFDPYVLLVGPNGEVVDENDDADGRMDLARVTARLPESGRYRVITTSYAAGETGAYQVAVRGSVAASAATASATRTPSAGGGQVYGVFVGVSDYGGRANDLAYTADDARRAADAMVAGGGMSRDNAIILTDRDATVANVRAAFADMGRQVGPDDTFVYFYSGHGARVPRDGVERSDPDGLDETIELYDAGIRDNEMSDLLDLINSNISLLVLDACFSGGFSKDVISVPGRIGFFSSEEDVTSQVASKFRAGGYLAQFVFDGVGERLADGNRDGAISAIELSQYIHERYRSDVKSSGPNDYVRTGGPQSGFQHFVADRGSIGPDQILFR